jgi:hypothetical protein
MSGYSYEGLVDLDDDVLLLEWDTACSQEQLQAMVDYANDDRSRVIAAPYRTYMDTETPVVLREPVWAMRRYNPGENTTRFVEETDTHTHFFPLGMTYLPRDLIRAFVATGHRFGDAEFSGWHYRNVTQEVPIPWDVRPIHLHYPIERMGVLP